MSKARVLFLGNADAARAQMAEAFLHHYAGDRFEAHSAGLSATEISAYTYRVMKEVGIDLDGQQATDVGEYLGRVHFGYLVTVCSHAEANCPKTFLGIGQRFYWDIEDPAKFKGSEAETIMKYREVRDDIDARIQSWLAEMDNSE